MPKKFWWLALVHPGIRQFTSRHWYWPFGFRVSVRSDAHYRPTRTRRAAKSRAAADENHRFAPRSRDLQRGSSAEASLLISPFEQVARIAFAEYPRSPTDFLPKTGRFGPGASTPGSHVCFQLTFLSWGRLVGSFGGSTEFLLLPLSVTWLPDQSGDGGCSPQVLETKGLMSIDVCWCEWFLSSSFCFGSFLLYPFDWIAVTFLCGTWSHLLFSYHHLRA